MKRDPRLQGLSSDHHQGLVLARRAAAGRADAAEVLRRFETELEPHFRVEEEALLPALEAAGGATLVLRTRRDHAELRALAAAIARGEPERLSRLGALLEEHIRFEERELFPEAERLLPDAPLERVNALAPHPTARRGGESPSDPD